MGYNLNSIDYMGPRNILSPTATQTLGDPGQEPVTQSQLFQSQSLPNQPSEQDRDFEKETLRAIANENRGWKRREQKPIFEVLTPTVLNLKKKRGHGDSSGRKERAATKKVRLNKMNQFWMRTFHNKMSVY